MVAHNIQGTKKMVIKIILLFVQLFSFYDISLSQEEDTEKKMILWALVSKDTVFMGDTLKVIVSYKNNTDDFFLIHPQSLIGLVHNHEYFITYDSPDRITYKLKEFTDYDSIINLRPKEEYKQIFCISADSKFFYEGENTISVYYRVFEFPSFKKKRKKSKKEPVVLLWSNPIKIYVFKRK